MNLEESIAILKREGWIINHDPLNKCFLLKRPGWIEDSIYSYSDLVSLARGYTSDDLRNTKIKKAVKTFTHKKNRAATKQKISHENWDDIPSKDFTKSDNIWNWD